MGFAIVEALISSIPIKSRSQNDALVRLGYFADDTDCADKGRERGKNIYPSQAKLARMLGMDERNMRRYIIELIDTGWIRDNPTERFLQTYPQGNRLVKCREINLSMLARFVDVAEIIQKQKIAKSDPRFDALRDAASVFRPDDWITRLWHIDYKPRLLGWDGELDSISPALWDTKDTPKEEKSSLDDRSIQGTMSEEELEAYTNKYRIDL